jgi:phytoene dehydrogenase-like protein
MPGDKGVSQVVVIGAGHNGLTAAFYLARAGLKPLVLEQRAIVGGCAVTEEIAAGYRCATLAHATGPLRPSLVRDMQLARRVEFIQPDPTLVALTPEGRALAFSRDIGRTADAMRPFSAPDAVRYPDFCATMERLAAFLTPVMQSTPPSLDEPAAGELWGMLKLGRRFRALGRDDAFRLLRWMPMAVADLAAEWFGSDVVQGAIAARAIFGSFSGPWSAGTGAMLLLNMAADPVPGGSSVMVRGGAGALTHAMADAAREGGAEIRTNAAVARVLVRDGRAAGVALEDGTQIDAAAVISSADPKRTFLRLVDPVDLNPSFLTKIRNYRSPGIVAKLNVALNGLPAFRGVANPADLRGRVHVAPSVDYLERAFDASKYGEISESPYLDIAFPSLHDPSLAPPGHHVMSVHAQFAPYKLSGGHDWTSGAEQLWRIVMRTLDQYAPGIESMIVHRQIVTPLDLERRYGLTGGHILHGEPALDQLFTMRPVLGWAQYRTPIDALYLCGAGSHPGGGLTGGPGQNAAREIAKAVKRQPQRVATR